MRIHVTVRDRQTTISIEDILIDFMAAKMCRSGDLFWIGMNGKKSVIKWIKKTIKNDPSSIPEKHISQWVRDRIIQEIVSPDILEKSIKSKALCSALKSRAQTDINKGTLPTL